MMGSDPTGGAGAGYVGGAQDTALDQTAGAKDVAASSSTSGQNVPNGTATSTAQS